jgi:hypothetical protein
MQVGVKAPRGRDHLTRTSVNPSGLTTEPLHQSTEQADPVSQQIGGGHHGRPCQHRGLIAPGCADTHSHRDRHWQSHSRRQTVHQTIHALQLDLEEVYELSDNIYRLFNVSTFTKVVHDIQNDTNVTLDGCAKEAQRSLDIFSKLGLQVRGSFATRAYLSWRLDRRLDDIDRMKRSFQGHKSSIQLAFQLLTTWVQLCVQRRLLV